MTPPASDPAVEPAHEHLFHPGVAAAGRAARATGRSHLIGCALCGESVQLGVADQTPRRPWRGPVMPWPALEPGFVRPD